MRVCQFQDQVTLTLADVAGGTFSIVSESSNGIEWLNIVSNTAPNALDGVTQVNGTTMATMFISGTQDVAIVAPLDDSVIFIDASTLTWWTAGGGWGGAGRHDRRNRGRYAHRIARWRHHPVGFRQ